MTELQRFYERERERLMALAALDKPQGEYRNPVFGWGDTRSGIILFGEAPGAEETLQSVPFVGKAGKQLNELLAASKIARESIYISNIVKYRPVIRNAKTVKNRPPETDEITASLPLVLEEIRQLQAKTIITMGNTPLKAMYMLSGEKAPLIGAAHGVPVKLNIRNTAYVLFPLYHPASGIYNPALKPVMRMDAKRLGEHLVKQGF